MKFNNKYQILFGKYKGKNKGNKNDKIPEKDIEILYNFEFIDYTSNSVISSIKDFFFELC